MRRLAITLSALGFLWVSGTTVYLLTAAGYDAVGTASALTTPDGGAARVGGTLVTANGPWVAALLVGVTLFVGLPLGVALTHPPGQRATTWIAGFLLLGFAFVAGFSVGLLYLPSALVLMAAAALAPRGEVPARRRTADPG